MNVVVDDDVYEPFWTRMVSEYTKTYPTLSVGMTWRLAMDDERECWVCEQMTPSADLRKRSDRNGQWVEICIGCWGDDEPNAWGIMADVIERDAEG